ncbi:MAG: amidohydrolase family protein [Fimbriimonadaceae bacterium]|nr:amidohydrolase family protein [Fimbriimonadaceae bacterium]
MTRDVWAVGPSGFGAYSLEWDRGQPVLGSTASHPELLLSPGFVDVHIHGGWGVDLMEANTAENLRLAARLEACGYEAALATSVSCSAENAFLAFEAVPEGTVFVGAHLEGPFLSPLHPGAQPPGAILDPSDAGPEWEKVFDHPMLRLVTLAPERPGAATLAQRLRSRGVTVSMGHTDATFEQASESNAVTHATHWPNAMRGFHHREPGACGYALMTDTLTTELIYDREHVAPMAASLLVRTKPTEKLIAVSDATMATGLPPGERLTMWGLECVVGEGTVRLASNGALAGSAVSLYDVFRNLHDDFCPETAIRACAMNPRPLAGLFGPPSRWLLMDRRLEFVEMVGGPA